MNNLYLTYDKETGQIIFKSKNITIKEVLDIFASVEKEIKTAMDKMESD